MQRLHQFFKSFPSLIRNYIYIQMFVFKYMHKENIDLSIAKKKTNQKIPTTGLNFTQLIFLAFPSHANNLHVLIRRRIERVRVSLFPLHFPPARCASNLTRSLLMFPLAVVTRRSYRRLSHWLLHFRQLPVYIRRTATGPYPDKTRTCSSFLLQNTHCHTVEYTTQQLFCCVQPVFCTRLSLC